MNPMNRQIRLAQRPVGLPGPQCWQQTEEAVAQLAAPGWPALTAVSLHLSLRATERQRHVAAVLERLAGLPGPLVVAGDLNELADGAASGSRGQGLFVARTYLAKMGGTISVRNLPDGVSFALSLQRV